MKGEKEKPTSEKRRAERRPPGPRPPLAPASPELSSAPVAQSPARLPLGTPGMQALSRPTPIHGVPVTLGSAAAADWLRALGVVMPGAQWYVELALHVGATPVRQAFDGSSDTRFHVHVYPEEWGFFFGHGSRASWIRVTERPFVHGRDDHALLEATPQLRELGELVRDLEQRHRIRFRRDLALVRTNVEGVEAAARAWLAGL